MADKPRVFICYSKQDQALALDLFNYLRAAEVDPWFDNRCLVQGDLWDHEIKRAVASANAFVVLLRQGFDDVGYRQKEVKLAIDAWQLRPPGHGFIIPFIVEPCTLPGWCEPIHAGADLLVPTDKTELLRAIEKHCKVRLVAPVPVASYASGLTAQGVDQINPLLAAKNVAIMGRSRFDAKTASDLHLPKAGSVEFAFAVCGPHPPAAANQSFLHDIFRYRRPAGWPLWVDSRAMGPELCPYVYEKGWEAYLKNLGRNIFRYFDFWRILPDGYFYQYRMLWEDLGELKPTSVKPNTLLDFVSQTKLVAEAVGAASAFARLMKFNVTESQIGIQVRWSGLDGRFLVGTGRSFASSGPSRQNIETTEVVMQAAAGRQLQSDSVKTLVSPLFALFDGQEFEDQVLDPIIAEVLNKLELG